ncbi:MAG: TetR/AcrR family transcriptional regulator [Paludibacter sp.]
MEETKDLIVQTAARMFDQYGIRSISIDNVCKELRISKKTFYAYFPQKEDLVEAVLNFQRKINYEKFGKLFKNKNAIDSLIVIIKEIKKSAEQESTSMCFDLEKYYPKINEKFEQIKRDHIRIGFEANLRQGIQEGYYREDLDVELLSYFHSIQLKNSFEIMGQDLKMYSKKRLIDFSVDMMVHLIANEKGLKYMEEHYNKTE